MPNINELHIFLDIDGVLNRKSDWTNKFTFNETCLNNFVKLLTDLKEQYNCLLKIILTSTWRTGYQEGNEKIFKPLTDKLRGINLRINGITPITANKTRQQEINYYISRNNFWKIGICIIKYNVMFHVKHIDSYGLSNKLYTILRYVFLIWML